MNSARKPCNTELLVEFRDEIAREQVRIAFADLPTMQTASFIVALVLSGLVRNIVAHANILAWNSMILSVVIGRVALFYRFKRVREGAFDGQYWGRAYLGLALLSGVVWGLSAFIIFPAGNPALISLFLLTMLSLSASTVISHSSIKPGPAAWVAPTLTLYAIRCAMEKGAFGYPVSFLIILYMITVLRYAVVNNRAVASVVSLKFENLGLLKELRQKNETLQRANEAALDANMAKSRFLAMVSHELRTPLNAIIGFGELAQEQGASGQTAQYLDIIEKSAMHLLELVNDLLDLSRIEAGKMEIAAEVFDVRDQIRCLEAVFAHQAARKGVAFSITVGGGTPPQVTGDPLRLRQVLSNIIGNALKFTEKGAVEVNVTAHPDAGKASICFAVRDTGIGIRDDKKASVFERFAQADPDITRLYGGSGLGAPVARQLARLMGGDITFESRKGEGSVFYITIPFAQAASNEAPVSTDCPPASARGDARKNQLPLKILVAEDNQFNQRFMVDALVLRGHAVTLAGDGKEAFESYIQADGSFDLVLMDIMMPVMDGYEAARKIREAGMCRAAPCRTPMFAVTASSGSAVQKQCLEAGFDGVIEKPVTSARLDYLLKGFSGPEDAGGGCSVDSICTKTAAWYDDIFDSEMLKPVSDSPERMARFAGLLLKDLDRGMELLHQALASSDHLGIARAAHGLKGATLAVKVSQVSALAGELETYAKEGNNVRIENAFARVRDACGQLQSRLRKMGAPE